MSEASHNAERLERELAELGEAPPEADELALEAVDDEPEVASVARLHELAEPLQFDALSELELHRGWREIERRLDAREPEAADAEAERSGGGVRRWPYFAAGLAVAAAVLFVIVNPKGEIEAEVAPPSADEVAELGDAARASLRVLDDGKTDTQRAASLAADYQHRLEEQGG